MTKKTNLAVLITGASSGIGRATAEYLAGRGFTVTGTSRRGPKKPEPVGGNGTFYLVTMDVTDPASVSRGVKQAADLMGTIDILINNAGISHTGPFESVPEDEGRAIMETNFFGALNVTRAALPLMRERKSGLIINISSLGGIMGIPFQTFYVASKYALEGFSESLRYEVKHLGIDVALVEPGHIRTEIAGHRKDFPPGTKEYSAGYESAHRVIRESVDEAEPPAVIAGKIYRIISKRKPGIRYPAGKGSVMIALLVRLLPQVLREKVLLGYYGL